MKKINILKILSLLLGLFFTFVHTSGAQPLFPYIGEQVRPGTHPPRITHSFAVDKGYYGYILKIYIEADDPDGDMTLIATEISRVGSGRYPTDWTVLKPPYQRHFKGYLQLHTFDFRKPSEWTYITLKVSVIDKTRNASNTVVLPFTFESGIGDPYKYTLPNPFTKEDPKLGHISIMFRSGRSGN